MFVVLYLKYKLHKDRNLFCILLCSWQPVQCWVQVLIRYSMERMDFGFFFPHPAKVARIFYSTFDSFVFNIFFILLDSFILIFSPLKALSVHIMVFLKNVKPLGKSHSIRNTCILSDSNILLLLFNLYSWVYLIFSKPFD